MASSRHRLRLPLAHQPVQSGNQLNLQSSRDVAEGDSGQIDGRNGLRSAPPSQVMRNNFLKIGGAMVKRFLSISALVVACVCLTPSNISVVHVLATEPTHHAAQIKSGPELESTNESMAIIRWTTTNPGGTDLHYGIVHYGTDAMNLTQVAKSPNRRNSSHPEMIFRVRVAGLNPQTSYYYTVESAGATGVSDGVSSPVRTFKTR